MNPSEILAQFESLGENCEFGLAQHHAGIEPFGLFRWAYTPRSVLRQLLTNKFESFATPDDIELVLPWGNEWGVSLSRYNWTIHTWASRLTVEKDKIRERETKRLAYLKDRMLALLAEGSRTFVIRGHDSPLSINEALDLYSLISNFGKNKLLFVTEGMLGVKQIEPGLYHGQLPRLWRPWQDWDKVDTGGWVSICQGVLDDPAPVGLTRYLSVLAGQSRSKDYFDINTARAKLLENQPFEAFVDGLTAGLIAQRDHAGIICLRDAMKNHGLADPFESPDLAYCQISITSSTSTHSHSRDRIMDAAGANGPNMAPDYGFHTDHEASPWWMVDLGGEFIIDEVRIVNRKACAERFHLFVIESSRDSGHWSSRFIKLDPSPVSSDPSDPWRTVFEDPFLARFVRIRHLEATYLHLRRVSIFGRHIGGH